MSSNRKREFADHESGPPCSRKILHRKLNLFFGVLSVCVAVATPVGALTVLRNHDRRTEQIIAAKEAETEAKMAVLENSLCGFWFWLV